MRADPWPADTELHGFTGEWDKWSAITRSKWRLLPLLVLECDYQRTDEAWTGELELMTVSLQTL